tara:strand:- start:13931 stop:14524 length:594 start_codon:yes stop_codon:yes gene_type:complete
MKNNKIKNIFDIVLIICFFPLFLFLIFVISIGILLTMGYPIFFIQERSGINGKKFNIIKFRTMINNNLSDEKRLTKFGNFLRSHSLDEIPEIINVIKGDMSLVGPRPLFLEYNKLYSEHQKKRLLIKPGITGLAQVYGRNNISWEDKFDLDIRYVNNWSLILDIKIILITLIKIFWDNDIYDKNNKFIKKFQGTKKN